MMGYAGMPPGYDNDLCFHGVVGTGCQACVTCLLVLVTWSSKLLHIASALSCEK